MRPRVSRLRENLLLGLLTLTPVALTFWVLFSVVDYLDSMLFRFLPIGLVHFPGFGLIVAFVILLAVGTLARTVAGKFLNSWSDALFRRVPIVRGLYNVAKQMSSAFFSADASAAFKRVVLVNFPSSKTRAIAFVTGHYGKNETVVFVPTAPNPTSGYVLIVKDDDLEEIQMSIPDALQCVVSCGATLKS